MCITVIKNPDILKPIINYKKKLFLKNKIF